MSAVTTPTPETGAAAQPTASTRRVSGRRADPFIATSKLKCILPIIAIALAVSAHSAQAATPGSETITSTWQVPSFPTAPPYTGTASGDFTATGTAFDDAGTMSVIYHLAAVPSPIVGVLHTDRTLIGRLGNIALRCNQLASDFSNPSAVPDSGKCTVISGAGAYAGLHGQGTITGVGELAAPPFVLTEIVRLSIP